MTNSELYQKLTSAADQHKALVEHFSFLADTDEFHLLLETVMNKAKSVELTENQLIIHFPSGNDMTCSEPAEAGYEKYPDSFLKTVCKHEYISFPDNGGWNLTLGDTQSLELEAIEEGGGEIAYLIATKEEDVFCPMSDYSDWWIYHPTNKNSQGEPLLCLFSHESCDIEKTVDCNAGELFLQKVAGVLEEASSEKKELTENDKRKLIEKALVEAKTGFTNILIKQECDYALYVCDDKGYDFFTMLTIYPNGYRVFYTIYDNLTKSVIQEEIKDIKNCYYHREGKYRVWSGDKQVDGTQQGNRIEICFAQGNVLVPIMFGGWNSGGNLIIPEIGAEDNLFVNVYKYIGYVKNGKVVFSDDFGITEK